MTTTQSQPPFYLGNLLRESKGSQIGMQLVFKEDGRWSLTDSGLNRLIIKRHFTRAMEKNRPAFDALVKSYLTSNGISAADAERVWEDGSRYVPQLNRKSVQDRVKKILAREIQESEEFTLPELTMLSQKALRHFGFKKDPFINEVNQAEDLFLDEQQHYVREQMIAATLTPSILALIAESGAGKSHVVMAYYEYLREREPNVVVVEPKVVDKKKLNDTTLLFAIARTLHITLPSDPEQRIWVVQEAMQDGIRSGYRYVLLIEEAHLVHDDVLKLLKVFSEWKSGFNRMMTIILVGQTELKDKLASHKANIREFSKRCTIVGLYPLGDALPRYLSHKMERAGSHIDKVFTPCGLTALRDALMHKRSFGQLRGDDVIDMSHALSVNSYVSNAMEKATEVDDKVTAELINTLKNTF